MTTPNIILASGSILFWTNSAAVSASNIPRSLPPLMLSKTPLAPSIEDSNNGLLIACFAASSALFSPLALPIPIWAIPVSYMIVFTSAKSRFTRPLSVIKSDIPWTPCLNTSSDILKASIIEVFLSEPWSNLSFGIITKASTFSFKQDIPLSALCILFFPSNVNGFVTTATVRIPKSFEIWATIGAAPVPVPPPIPAVTNTISAPLIAFDISSLDSSAAFSPIKGSLPAPSPLVIFSPICILVAALELLSACLSVLTAMKSTSLTPIETILLTALLPAPPTPITFILAIPSKLGPSLYSLPFKSS